MTHPPSSLRRRGRAWLRAVANKAVRFFRFRLVFLTASEEEEGGGRNVVFGRTWITAMLTPACLALLAPPAQAQYGEYEVKAAFMFHFVQFVKWPSGSAGPVTVGILGDDPFGGALAKAVQDEANEGRKVAVKRSRKVEDLKGCQIVFVSSSERANLTGILASLAGAHVLTVGDYEGFAKQGGTIGFSFVGEKVRFEINNGAARRSGLEISSRLLKLASRVGDW